MGKTGVAKTAKSPDYPNFDAMRPNAVESYLSTRNLLEPSEHVVRLEAGPYPTRNVTVRVVTSERTLFLKQFLVWPDNGVAAPALNDRFHAESLFHRAARISRCSTTPLPALVHQDANEKCLVFEDAGQEEPSGNPVAATETEALAWFLVTLHHHSRSVPECARHCSQGIRRWHAARLFPTAIARKPDRGYRWRKRLFGQIGAVAAALADARSALLAGGTSLVHGDFLPGNWVRTAFGLRVVDAEFSFFGCAEFDAGAFLAGMMITPVSGSALRQANEVLQTSCVCYDSRMVATFAAVHLCAMLDSRVSGTNKPHGSKALAMFRRLNKSIELGDLSPILV